MRLLAGILAMVMLFALPMTAGSEGETGEHPVIVLRVAEYGDIYAELYPEYAPVTVENFLKLVDSGFYNGLTFHRIIEGFMAQGGCPLGNGTGGSGTEIKGEFSANGVDNPLTHERGVLSMARSSNPDSASSQFFIMHADAQHLDGNYAAFGRVLSGMGVVDALCANAAVTDNNGTVAREDQPVITEAARADRAEAEAAAAREAENGAEGGVYDDPTTGVAFPVPEGWHLESRTGNVAVFTNGEAEFTLMTMDIWQQIGKSLREQYAAGGSDRESLNTEAFSRTAFAGTAGVAETELTEETVNGSLWLTAAKEDTRIHTGAMKGTVILLTGDEGAAQALEAVLNTMTVE